MKIKQNEGEVDRALRIIVSTCMIIFSILTQTWWILLLGVPLFITGAVGFCGVYKLLGISTCPVTVTKKKKRK